MTSHLSPQCSRLVAYLKARGGWVSSWDLVMATHILNTTARISEVRQAGIGVECRAVDVTKGHYEYRLAAPAAVPSPAAPVGHQSDMFSRTPWNPVAVKP